MSGRPEKNKEELSVIVRSPEEVHERIQQLEELMDENDIWAYYGELGKIRSPEYGPIYDKLKTRRDELRWLLGEDIEIET